MKKKASPSKRRTAGSSSRPALQTKKKSVKKIAARFGENNPLFQLTPIPSYLWRRRNGDFLLDEYNAAAEESSGGRAKDFLGASARLVYADRPDILRQIGECYAQRANLRAQMTYVIPATTDELQLDVSYIFIPPNGVLVQIENLTPRLQAEEQVRQRLVELEAINQVTKALRSAETLEQMLQLFLASTLKTVNASDGAIWLYDPANGRLQQEFAMGWPKVLSEPDSMLPDEGITGYIFKTGNSYRTREFASDAKTHPSARPQVPAGWGGVGVPLFHGEQVVGAMFVSVQLPREIDPHEEWLIKILGEVGGTAIHRMRLYSQLGQKASELSLAYDATLEGWARALDIRDQETESHTRRTVDLTLRLSEALGVPKEELLDIRRGALLHDIGKMGVPDSILRKPGPLTEGERSEMQKHPQFAFDMLRGIKYLASALAIPYFHHEYWDGNGYPQGLKGEDIPLAARIFSVVDVYDALISARPYRAAWTRDEALKYVEEHTGTQFDPQVVKKFLAMMRET